jgi:hypothetical protein
MQSVRTWRLPLVCLLLFVAGALLAPDLLAPRPMPVVDAGDRTSPAGEVSAVVADAGSAPAVREEIVAPPVDEPGFEARVDELVQLGQRTAELAQQDETAAATANDRVVRDRFADLMARFPDAGERGLAMLVGLSDEPSEPRDAGRRVVLQLVLTTECERRDHDAEATRERAPIDTLVEALLRTMPATATTADAGWRVLTRQRFVRATHEGAVLALVRLAGEQNFRRDIATDLLLTLWENVQRFGERSSDELSRLALLLLDDADPSQRTAACHQLLKDARYRNLVLSWLRERGDKVVAAEVAGVAARELPPAEALSLLRELATTLPRAPNAYLVLGFRAPDLVADDYRALLAAGTHADVRCDLVTGVGMTQTPLGLEIAELALHNDPSLDVRMQAVFALTSRGDAALGERALARILDEAGVAGDKQRLAAAVLALQNLAATGDANAIDRVGRRLLAMPLSAASRQQLEGLLQRCLPGGAPGATAGG